VGAKTREGGPKTAPDLLPGEIAKTHSSNRPGEQFNSAPEVVIRRRGGSAFVTVQNPPWGWPNLDREFLNPRSPAVDRYADTLRDRLAAEARREDERRERKHAAKLVERETLALGADALEFRQQAAGLAAKFDLPIASATLFLGFMRERRQ
jgi:hypothetical protein